MCDVEVDLMLSRLMWTSSLLIVISCDVTRWCARVAIDACGSLTSGRMIFAWRKFRRVVRVFVRVVALVSVMGYHQQRQLITPLAMHTSAVTCGYFVL